MKQNIFYTVIILLFLSCNKEKYDSIPHGYYTVEYTNMAWGYQYNGWIIDADGNVMSFNLPTSNWNGTDSLGFISETDLLNNIAMCDTSIEKVTERKLYLNNKLIQGAAMGTLTEKKNTSNDAGSTKYSCYYYDIEMDAFKKVLLNVEGDWSYHNESTEAKKITTWMKKIN